MELLDHTQELHLQSWCANTMRPSVDPRCEIRRLNQNICRCAASAAGSSIAYTSESKTGALPLHQLLEPRLRRVTGRVSGDLAIPTTKAGGRKRQCDGWPLPYAR
jgi:hypothetical protein